MAEQFTLYLERTRDLGEETFKQKLDIFEACGLALLEAANNANRQNNTFSASSLLSSSALLNAEKFLSLDVASVTAGSKRTTFVSTSDEFVYNLYRNLPSGFAATSSSSRSPASSNSAAADAKNAAESERAFSPFLYGEIEPEGVAELIGEYMLPSIARKCMKVMSMMSSSAQQKLRVSFPIPVSFVDLGSGVGKACMDAALSCDGVADEQFIVRSVGVELDEGRHQVAVKAQLLATEIPQQGGNGDGDESREFAKRAAVVIRERVRFCHQDMLLPISTLLTKDFNGESKQVAVFAFCCGVAFDNDMCAKIVKRVLAFGSSSTELLGAVFLFKEWPTFAEGAAAAAASQMTLPAGEASAHWKVTKGHIATSWMSNAPCFILEANE